MSFKHKDLVKIAAQWLARAHGCNPVFMEKGSSHVPDMPDAIGWTAHECIVVECKVSRSDLKANEKKILTLGTKRYLCLPAELYNECLDCLPEGFGIVLVNEHHQAEQVRFKGSRNFERNQQSEIHYLRSRLLAIQNYGRVGL